MIKLKKAQEIIQESFGEDAQFCALKNFRLSTKKENTVQLTVNILSLDVLFTLMEHDLIENVYFHASASPPRSHVDPSAMRFRVYVQFITAVQDDSDDAPDDLN